ncbi:MAG: RecX family transcriptional regulator [Alphaproteobacteria bacterium]|nr:RecX family transcriptional regulator [Alphaproteobacteria bacterium]
MVKQITEKRLEHISIYYLQRYESCASKLKDVLYRRVLKIKMQGGEIPPQIEEWISKIVLKMQDLGYIDDMRYIENTVRRLQNNGKSMHYILNKLKQDGLSSDLLDTFLQENTSNTFQTDLQSAQRLVYKKKLGCFRNKELQKQMYQKDLAVLARAGFSYEIAKKALETLEN